MNSVLAIDPGQSGGAAVMQFGKTYAHAMPATQGDVLELIRSIKVAADIECEPLVCVLEEVGGFAGKAQPGSAMFKFGEHYGFIKGVVQTLGIRLVLVRPQIWQKTFGLGTASRCVSKSEWKNKLKAEAQRRFPHLAITLKTADALLILDWFTHHENTGRSATAATSNDFSAAACAAAFDSLAPARSALEAPSPVGEFLSPVPNRLKSTNQKQEGT